MYKTKNHSGKSRKAFLCPLLSALLLLSSCGTEGALPEQPSSEPTEVISEEATATVKSSKFAAYKAALNTLYLNGTFPDGTRRAENSDSDEVSFAIFDVDGDLNEELIILDDAPVGAYMTAKIFGCDFASGRIHTELSEFPLLTFYDNGVIEAGWSHNQGLAGDNEGEFWPYNLYEYDRKSDTYRLFASVDAWDKSYAPQNGDGEPFPDEVDRDGDGYLYFVGIGGFDDSTPVVDGEGYEMWRNSRLGSARRLKIDFYPLNEKNIEHIY